MNHLPVLPILVPLLAGCVLLLAERAPAALRRGFAVAATLVLLLLGVALLRAVVGGEYLVYALGDWPVPFGIVLVVDRLSAALVLLTAVVAVASLAYAIVRGTDAAGPHFLALFQFQLLGINGALLTGDLFNLFVFFEILLIASYTLLLHGMGAARVRCSDPRRRAEPGRIRAVPVRGRVDLRGDRHAEPRRPRARDACGRRRRRAARARRRTAAAGRIRAEGRAAAACHSGCRQPMRRRTRPSPRCSRC